MASTPTRLPKEVAEQASALAKVQGRQVGEVIAEAWKAYFEANREEFASNLERSAELIRNGDTAGLAEHLRSGTGAATRGNTTT